MATYSIKDIEKMSGIKAHTIRMWERRFGLVIPKRTDTNIRYYSDEDLRNILNISILNQNGLKISKIAKLNKEDLREKVANLLDKPDIYSHVIDALLFSMLELDENSFNNSFNNALKEYGFEKLIENIMFPFLERIGILWQTDTIKPAQEHFIVNLLRQKIILKIQKEITSNGQGEDKIIFFLPEGELHEVGLLFYSYIARQQGYEVIYLGASVPVEDLKEVERVTNAKAFFSSYVGPSEKAQLENMFINLRETFPEKPFYVTGYQIREHSPEMPNNFHVITSSSDFRACLLELYKAN
ncbi:MAG: MerR family transcriptional regulator [Bacteroidales bacterium]|nr:MerR family transcriptional regulator [Bacteroidales bacterium]